jgi:hypothetical protein
VVQLCRCVAMQCFMPEVSVHALSVLLSCAAHPDMTLLLLLPPPSTLTPPPAAHVRRNHQVVRPCGLVSIMCYIGHPGGLEEYEAVRDMLAGLSVSYWTSSELRLLNRPSAPVLVLLWRRPDAGGRGPAAA